MLLASCGKDDEAAGYYLRGRAFDAVSLNPVTGAELTLISGKSTTQTTSDQDGSYTSGRSLRVRPIRSARRRIA